MLIIHKKLLARKIFSSAERERERERGIMAGRFAWVVVVAHPNEA